MSKTIVSIVQASSVFMNLDASVTRAIGLIEQAAREGAKLVAFGETWLPGVARSLAARRALES